MVIPSDDVQAIAGTCIARYGEREWRLAVLTAEVHGHLGIYATLGAKMGLRAVEEMEAAGADVHRLSVLSYAGGVPPVSCLNDGLQIGSGATLGHGQIAVAATDKPRAEARFSCGEIAFSLRLKPEFERQIRNDIRDAENRFGHRPEYWQQIRSLALRYWQDWDRKEIFEKID